jgi:hypothetical protein
VGHPVHILSYEPKLFYGSLFGCTSRGKSCLTCLKMAESALKAAGRTLFDGTAQRACKQCLKQFANLQKKFELSNLKFSLKVREQFTLNSSVSELSNTPLVLAIDYGRSVFSQGQLE